MPPAASSVRPRMRSDAIHISGYDVVALTGEEALNEPFRFVIDLQSDENTPANAIDLTAAAGAVATLVFEHDDGPREVVGVISEATHLKMTADHVQTWRLVLRSHLWLLSLGEGFRSFLDVTVNDVINEVLNGYGLKCDLAPTTFTAQRIIQHGESHLDLLQRLLADEGMLWRMVPGTGESKLFTARDHQRLCPTSEVVKGALDAAMTGETGQHGHGTVLAFHATRRATLGQYRVVGHTPKQPDRPTVDESPVDGTDIHLVPKTGASIADLHAGVRDPGKSYAARKPAELLAERAAALASVATGESDLHLLGAGGCLELSGHQETTYNQRWVVTRIEHTWAPEHPGGLPTYRNRFSCVPFDGKPLRAPLRAPPRISGLRLGIVTDSNLPGGDMDDEPGGLQDTGLYEVEFPSEPDHKGKPLIQRMRVAHPWAGPERGFHFPLEVGDEVVVSHEHGDPARPFILGSLYSTANRGPIVSSEGGKASSGVLRSRTGHELRYDENSGGGKITLKSASGEHDLVLDDAGKSTALSSQGTFSASASSDASVSAGAKLNLTATGDAKLTTDAAGTMRSAGLLSISSTGGDVTISSPSKISLTVGGSSIVIEPAKITITAAEVGVTGTAKATMEAPTAQVGKAGGATTVIGATVGIDGSTSATVSAPAATVTATGEALLHGGTVTVSGTGAVAISGSSVGING